MSTSVARARLGLVVPLIVGCALSACGSSSGGDKTAPSAIRIPAANGTVTIPHVPARIVSLSPTATEDLYAVGAGKQVVAVDTYSDYPSNAPRTKLSETDPNIEAIAGYRPDLVITADDSNHVVEQLMKLGVPTIIEPPAANLSGVYSELSQIGTATGHPRAAGPIVATIREEVDAVTRSVQRPSRPLTVYHELEQDLFSANSHTFIGQMYSLLGLRNIADQAPGAGDYPKLSAEFVLRANPDLIVLADTVCCGQTVASVDARPGWRSITAVRSGAVLPVNDSVASEWGPRIVVFLKDVARTVRSIEQRSK